MDAKLKAKDSVLQKLIAEMGGIQVEKLRAKSPKFAKKTEEPLEEVETEAAEVEVAAPAEVEEDETPEGKALLLKLLAEMGE